MKQYLLAVYSADGGPVEMSEEEIQQTYQAVDAFNFQGDMPPQDIGNRTRYTHGWLRSSQVLRDQLPLRAVKWGCLGRPRPWLDRSLFYTSCRSEAEPR